MIENPEEIILDSTNNVFVGPNGYFKIVIDQFDGTTVKAWHVEDSKGNKTANLADRAQGKHIDVMVNGGNRTVAHFVNRYQADIMKYQQTQIQKLSTAPAAPAAKETPAPAPATSASSGVPMSVPIVIAVIAVAIIAFQATRNKGNKRD